MSVEAFSWALTVPVGGNQKVILLGLANHAHPDGTEAYPALDTLAGYAHCDRSTARRNVRKLVADGWAVEDGTGPKGQTKYRLPLDRGGKTPRGGKRDGVASEPPRGGTSARDGVAPMPPEPSIEPSIEQSKRENAREDVKTQIPEGFPDELRPHAREALRILKAVAADHPAAKAVWPREVGLVIMAFPRRPLVATAHELARWAVDPPRPIKDVAATYRTFLKRERDLASLERLADDGTPTTEAASRGTNVHPIRQANGKPSAGQLLRELDAANPRLHGQALLVEGVRPHA